MALLVSMLTPGLDPADAAGAWDEQAQLSTSSNNDGRTVAIEGNTIVAQSYVGSSSWAVGTYATWDRAADGSWTQGPVVPVSGRAVDMDGDLLVIGNPNAGSGGVAYVLTRSAPATWTTVATLSGSDTGPGDLFGYSVAVAGDWITVGALRDDEVATDAGAAYVFERTTSGFTQTAKLTAPDGSADDQFGYAVATEPGGRVVVGAPRHDETSHTEPYLFTDGGAAYVSEIDSIGTRLPSEKIVVPTAFASPNPTSRPTLFGTAVATSEVGLVAVGAGPASVGDPIQVYEPSSGGWVLHSQLQPTEAGDVLPSSALDWEGDVLVAGLPSANSAGSSSGTAYVYEYDRIAGRWDETYDSATGFWTGTEVEPAGLVAYADAGYDVAVDRDTVVVGVPDYSSSAGDGATFPFVPSDWTYPGADAQGPPAPAVGVAPNPAGASEDIAFTATANDATTGGSTIADIEYRLDGGTWASMTPLDAAFDAVQDTGIATIRFASQGIHQACARGIDSLGNVGDTACIDVQVGTGDVQPPVVTLDLAPNPADPGQDVTITVGADDTTTGGSSIAVTEYRVDGGSWTSILSPDDGLYDSPAETGTTQVSFPFSSVHEVCGRALDDANNLSEPACKPLTIGDAVPLSVTFTKVALTADDLDSGGTADLYGRVGFLIPAQEIELSNPDAAITMTAGDTETPYWHYALDVSATDSPLKVAVGLADEDPGLDDLADIHPGSAGEGVVLAVDLQDGTWPGAPLAQDCFTGDDATVCVAISVRSPTGDEDGDGLLDPFELYGYDEDGDGTVDIGFPALGTNVCRPDVLVEYDWMAGQSPRVETLPRAVAAFDAAPVHTAPLCVDDDGQSPEPGINLIVDEGDVIDTERGIDCDRIVELGDANLSELRRPFFFWSAWVHDINKVGGTTSGVSCGGGPYFVTSLGNYSWSSRSRIGIYGAIEDEIRTEAGTFMHELGHQLGLPHGGVDSVNFKPNHVSIMNYLYQFVGQVQASDTTQVTLDFSRGTLPTLDEDALIDTPLNAAADVLIAWRNPLGTWVTGAADQPIDWDQSGTLQTSSQAQDIGGLTDGGGSLPCVTAGDDKTLDTTAASDDTIRTDDEGTPTAILSGPDGICDTAADSEDDQARRVGTDTRILKDSNDWLRVRTRAQRAFGGGGVAAEADEHTDPDVLDPAYVPVLEAWAAAIDAAPVVSVDTSAQQVQYSDQLTGPTITVRDPDSTPTLALDADAPSWVSLSGGSCESFDNGVDDGLDGQACTWTLAGTADAPADSYDVPFTASDGATNVSDTAQVVVTEEDATVAFPGDLVSVQVDEPGGDSGPFSLEVAITERQPDTPTTSAAPGDIGNVALADVTVELVPIGPGSAVTATCEAGAVLPDGYAGTLPLDCDLDDVPVNTYSVVVTVAGDHYAGTGEDVLTVFDPSLGFTTGGGWFSWPDSGDRTNFGFTISYNRRGTHAKGHLLLIRHLADGTTYRVKSNAIEGLSVGEDVDAGWASFTTKVTYQDPSMSEPEGNHDATVYVEDRGGGDRLWIEVRDRAGAVIDALSLDAPPTQNAISIAAGDLVVPHTTRRGGHQAR